MVRLILAFWLLAEALAYVLFFAIFPVSIGFLVGLCSLIVGAMALRLGGRQFIQDAMRAASSGAILDLRTAPLGLLGALFLLIPGFISDAIGLVLLIAGVVVRWRRPAQTPRTRDVELSRDEWTRLPDEPPK